MEADSFVTFLGRGVLDICNTISASTRFYTVDNAAVCLHKQESDHIDPIWYPLLGLAQMMIFFFFAGHINCSWGAWGWPTMWACSSCRYFFQPDWDLQLLLTENWSGAGASFVELFSYACDDDKGPTHPPQPHQCSKKRCACNIW